MQNDLQIKLRFDGQLNSSSKFKSILDEAIKTHVDQLMQQNCILGNALTSKEMQKAKLFYEYECACTASDLELNLRRGIEILELDTVGYANSQLKGQVLAKLEEMRQKIANLKLEDFSEAERTEILRFPSELLDQICAVAVAKFHAQAFSDSLAVFTFLTFIEPGDADYWFRLGISAQKAAQFALALRAYAAALLLDPKLIGAHIFSAECLLQMGLLEEVKEQLCLSLAIMTKEGSEAEWQASIIELESSLRKIRG